MPKSTDTATLIKALRTIARDIQNVGDVRNPCLEEASNRLLIFDGRIQSAIAYLESQIGIDGEFRDTDAAIKYVIGILRGA